MIPITNLEKPTTRFNINSKEFVPIRKLSTPTIPSDTATNSSCDAKPTAMESFLNSFTQSSSVKKSAESPPINTKAIIFKPSSKVENLNQQKIKRLAKQLNSLGVLDDGTSESESETPFQASNTKSPAKSDHNSSISSGNTSGFESTSIVSSLRMVADNSILNGSDDEAQKTISRMVSVPTSEHVAEIVGKQGCKIKALRAKTNTYIKTPARGEQPCFIITGHRNDVDDAIKEIQEAADHFTMIRQQRTRTQISNISPHVSTQHWSTTQTNPMSLTAPASIEVINPHRPEQNSPTSFGGFPIDSIDPALLAKQITLKVRVPYNVVGLVVGPKGATIKRVQQATQTYIVTPSRDKEPVFEVTGLRENVEKAREEIQFHIAQRTGSNSLDTAEEFKLNGIETDFIDPVSTPNHTSIPSPTPVKSSSIPLFHSPHSDTHETGKHLSLTLLRKAINSCTDNNDPPLSTHLVSQQPSPKSEPADLPAFGYNQQLVKTISSESSDSLSDGEKEGALETLQNLNEDERVMLSQVIEEMKTKRKSKPKQPQQTVSSLFEPDSLRKMRPAPSIDNVLIGKAEPPVNEKHNSGGTGHSRDSPQPMHDVASLRSSFDSNMFSIDSPRSMDEQGKVLLQKVASQQHVSSYSTQTIPTIAGVNRAGKCLVCREKPISMALVPCGHNLFCEDCAFRITQTNKNQHANPVCPECFEPVNMAIRIKM